MMPAHYAITDAAIVVVAAWAAMALWRSNKPLPAFAMACFAIPAAIGAIRLGGGLQAELAALHMGSAQLLGLAGAFMLTATCLGRVIRMDVRIIAIASLLIAAAVFFLGQALLPAFFLVALAVVLLLVVMLAVLAVLVAPAHIQESLLLLDLTILLPLGFFR